MAERVLVTGGTGKVGSLLVQALRKRGVEARAATRRPKREGEVRFDWRDPGTFATVLRDVDGVYLIAPTDTGSSLLEMQPFLEACLEEPRRLILQSASLFEEGGPMMGAVHGWLAQHAADWAVLRPSWFMQNFTVQYLTSIQEEGAITSAAGDGRVAFIDAADIAAVAAAVLTAPTLLPGTDPILTGPEALTYDEAAQLISDVAGYPVRHVRSSVKALARRYEGFGLPADYARILAGMDGKIAQGAENRTTDEVRRWTGRPPNGLRSFLEDRESLLER